MMSLLPLPWDSDFFGFSIARASLDETSVDDIVVAARERQVDCVYLVVPDADRVGVTESVRAGAILVDLRTELVGHLDLPHDPRWRRATAADLAQLEPLAVQLAASSRFRADHHFAVDAVDEMYRIWLQLCLNDGVVIVPTERITGFVGARGDSGEAHVELVYVTAEARGSRIAHRLITAAVSELGARRATVATQAANVVAQRLYQSLGFRTAAVSAVLHLWIRHR
jgi:ribosomal protein S18 acetylase RimI-like enzyme